MFEFLALLWCVIGIIVGIMVLFLAVVGLGAIIAEAVKTIRRDCDDAE